MGSIDVNTKINLRGIELIFSNPSVNRRLEVEFPEGVWENFPDKLKEIWTHNLVYLATVELTLMFKAKEIRYNTPFPLLKPFFDELFMKSFTYSGDVDSEQSFRYHQQLLNLNFSFSENAPSYQTIAPKVEESSINTLTFGKESLLSLGLAREIGLNPVPITVIDNDLDVEFRGEKIKSFTNKHLWNLIPKLEKELNLKVNTVKNELCKLRCNVEWDLDDTDLGSANVITEFLFLCLPFSYSHHSKYIVFGNENSCNKYYYSKEGVKCYAVYDQSPDWITHLNALTNILTQGKVQVVSLVQPLHEMAVAKVLYQRYPHLAKYQTSCHADELSAEENRWCHACAKCATCYVFMKGLGFNPEQVGLKDMFKLEYKHLFSLFNTHKDISQGYYSMQLARDEQLFAFHLAAKRGAQGELMDLFKKEFGKEAAAREEELREEIFKLHEPENIPLELWDKLKPIFEKELKK
ncbi:MAG: hypothetical protein AABX04_07965 [Nanoarchaeota archaeon]